MIRKKDYLGFVLILIFISILLGFMFINPDLISKSEFNESFENSQSSISLELHSEIIDYIEKRIMNIPGDALILKKNGKINDSQEEIIIETLDRASSEFSDFKYDYNEESLYQALFYAQASLAYYKSYPFITCANDVSRISSKYRPLFYYLSHSDKERILDIMSTSEGLGSYLKHNTRYQNDTEFITRRAKENFKIERTFDFNELKCDEFKSYLEENHSRQKLLAIFKLVMIIGIFISAFFLGLVGRSIKRTVLKENSYPERFSNFFFPEKVSDDTIDRILKTTTILAVFVALGVFFISSTTVLTKLLGILVFIDIFVLLSSIIVGISALNNNSEKGKRISYSLYTIGIIGFISISIYFFALFFFGELFNSTKSAFQTFLNNQTGVK